MDLKDKEDKFVYIDDERLAPILKYISDNKIPLLAHIGEPKNCWLPVEEMTTISD